VIGVLALATVMLLALLRQWAFARRKPESQVAA